MKEKLEELRLGFKKKPKTIEIETKDGKILEFEIDFFAKDGDRYRAEVKSNKYNVRHIEFDPERHNWGRLFFTNSKQIIPIKVMKTNALKSESKKVKVSRQKIEEVTSLVKKIQELTGKKIIFGESLIKEDPSKGAHLGNKKAEVVDPFEDIENKTPTSKTEIEESKANKIKKIKQLVKVIESKTGKKVVFEEKRFK